MLPFKVLKWIVQVFDGIAMRSCGVLGGIL
jgi:hypothetical protein